MQIQPIFSSQIEASENIINAFQKHCYVSLIAQMQSGKTDTFLLTAFECLRTNMVKNVVIFTGNSDLILKQQTIDSIENFSFKYQEFLNEKHGIVYHGRMEWPNVFQTWRRKISVLWSSDLAKKRSVCVETQITETLFIWEESHYAQSNNMLPFEFMKMNSLSANGKDSVLKSYNNLVLSVSATPFSEFAACVIHEQEKEIVYLNPGPNYLGVSYFLDNKIIGSHSNSISEFTLAMKSCQQLNEHDKKYGIVRIQDSTSFEQAALQMDWDCKFYNMNIQDIEDIHLTTAPEQNTIVFIKGALRMGQQVSKKHVGFCWESSAESNTDTLLQGLLGRMCSYDQIVQNIKIYIHEKIIATKEIEKYSKFIQCLEQGEKRVKCLSVMPVFAMNLCNNTRGSKSVVETHDNIIYEPGIPIYIPGNVIRLNENQDQNIKTKTNPLMASLSCILNDISKYPMISLSQSLATDIETRLCEKYSQHNWSAPSYKTKAKKIAKACLNGEKFRSGTNVKAIHIWKVDVVNPEFPDFLVDDVIIEVSFPIDKNKTENSIPLSLSVDENAAFIQRIQRDHQKILVQEIIKNKNIEMNDKLEFYLEV
jgi:hypothetical protein